MKIQFLFTFILTVSAQLVDNPEDCPPTLNNLIGYGLLGGAFLILSILLIMFIYRCYCRRTNDFTKI